MGHSAKVATVHQINTSFGVTGDIHTTEAGWNCPVHNIPLVWESTPTMTGWQGLMFCPGYDGTCRYDPEDDLEPVDKPQAVIDAETERDEAHAKAQDEDAIVINISTS